MFDCMKRGGFSEDKNRKGQVTAFIIISILVVAVVVLVFLLSPEARSSIGLGQEQTPQSFIQTCLEKPLREKANTAAMQGGSLEPEATYLFNGTPVQYLCYATEPYERCQVQVPFIESHLETNLEESIQSDVRSCFDDLQNNYQNSNLEEGGYNVEMLPGTMVATLNYTFSYEEGGESKRQEGFEVVLENNNLYLLTSIAQSILEWEASYGQADTTTYMNLYRDVTVRKFRQTDGTIVYRIEHDQSGDKFQLASRSMYFPAGYG
ncbi:MAG: hypothetical protein ABEI74_01425 [Candidatus Pacearchaeota archaeon]